MTKFYSTAHFLLIVYQIDVENPVNFEQNLYSFRGCTRPVCDAKIGGNGVGDVTPALFLNRVCRRKARRPGPLKVVAAQPAGHIYNLAYEIKAGNLF